MLAACTIVSCNYLHYARTLCESFLRAHPDGRFFVLVVDRPGTAELSATERFTTVWVEELGIPDFASIAFKYNILELNTCVKPSFLAWLLERHGVDRLVYLDPDTFVYSRMVEVEAMLADADLVLTPHILAPIQDDKRPSEQDLLLSGVYNLGFVGVNRRPGSRAFLEWWASRCLTLGYSDQKAGLFVDQKWIDLAPCLFDGARILRHPGYNVAYWNLHERAIERDGEDLRVNGTAALRFFHFSGIDLAASEQLSKYQDRHSLAQRADLRPLFDAYRESVAASGVTEAAKTRYAFDYFSNGARINVLTRRLYAASLDKFAGTDPFDASGPFYAFARSRGLLSASSGPPLPDVRPDPKDIRVRTIGLGLRALLRMLGPDRYAQLMKYLSHISILRNQRSLFWRE